MTKLFDGRPFSTNHRAESMVFARAVFLEVAAAHDHDAVFFIFELFFTSEVKSLELNIPKFKEPAEQSSGFADHDVMAAVASPFALAYLFVGGTHEKPSQFLHGHIDEDKRKEEYADGPTEPARNPLLGDPFIWQGRNLSSISRVKDHIFEFH